MKISYIFPVNETGKPIKEFFSEFKKKSVYLSNKEKEVFFIVSKSNEEDVKYLNSLAIRDENIKIILTNKTVDSSVALKLCLPYIKGDIVLLGDTRTEKLDLIFEKMLKRNEKGANIVQVKKKSGKFKEFFKKYAQVVYNFLVKLFTGKKDSCCETSIVLLDKLVLDVFVALEDKANFLRVCKELEGINIKTIYIDGKMVTEKKDLKTITGALITTYITSGVIGALLLSVLFVNIFAKTSLVGFNLIICGIIFVSLMCFILSICKHILDIRTAIYNDKTEFDVVNLKK
jgi:hypothetical protein